MLPWHRQPLIRGDDLGAGVIDCINTCHFLLLYSCHHHNYSLSIANGSDWRSRDFTKDYSKHLQICKCIYV